MANTVTTLTYANTFGQWLAATDALIAENILSCLYVDDGVKIFGEVDNRGLDIFVTLTYPKEIKKLT